MLEPEAQSTSSQPTFETVESDAIDPSASAVSNPTSLLTDELTPYEPLGEEDEHEEDVEGSNEEKTKEETRVETHSNETSKIDSKESSNDSEGNAETEDIRWGNKENSSSHSTSPSLPSVSPPSDVALPPLSPSSVSGRSLNVPNPNLFSLKKLKTNDRNSHPFSKCLLCDSAPEFVSDSDLQNHLHTEHNGQRTCFACPEFMVFPSQRALRAHISKHHNESTGATKWHRLSDPHQCTEYCGEFFKDQYHLRDHVGFHEYPFRCDKCVKAFNLLTRMQQHKANIHFLEDEAIIDGENAKRRGRGQKPQRLVEEIDPWLQNGKTNVARPTSLRLEDDDDDEDDEVVEPRRTRASMAEENNRETVPPSPQSALKAISVSVSDSDDEVPLSALQSHGERLPAVLRLYPMSWVSSSPSVLRLKRLPSRLILKHVTFTITPGKKSIQSLTTFKMLLQQRMASNASRSRPIPRSPSPEFIPYIVMSSDPGSVFLKKLGPSSASHSKHFTRPSHPFLYHSDDEREDGYEEKRSSKGPRRVSYNGAMKDSEDDDRPLSTTFTIKKRPSLSDEYEVTSTYKRRERSTRRERSNEDMNDEGDSGGMEDDDEDGYEDRYTTTPRPPKPPREKKEEPPPEPPPRSKCPYEGCGEDFAADVDLLGHTAEKHSVYVCTNPECWKVFASNDELQTHINETAQSQQCTSPCDMCCCNVPGSGALKQHLKVHTLPFRCDFPECGARYQFKRMMEEHARVHRQERIEMRLKQKEAVAIATAEKAAKRAAEKAARDAARAAGEIVPGDDDSSEPENPTREPMLAPCPLSDCPNAADLFTSDVDLDVHIQLVHNQFKCFERDCNEYFASANQRRQHHDNKQAREGLRLPHSCDLCGHREINSARLYRHSLWHVEMIQCDFCGGKIPRSSYQKHVKNRHHSKIELIDPIIIEKENYLRAARPPPKIRRSPCGTCGAQFNSDEELVDHVCSEHQKWVCVGAHCYLTFDTFEELQKHFEEKRGEDDGKEKGCTLCCSSVDRGHFPIHYRSHAQSVFCPLCDFRCVKNEQMKNHVQQYHPDATDVTIAPRIKPMRRYSERGEVEDFDGRDWDRDNNEREDGERRRSKRKSSIRREQTTETVPIVADPTIEEVRPEESRCPYEDCDREFASDFECAKHIRIQHHKFFCFFPFCGKTFKTDAERADHFSVHRGDCKRVRYSCTFCGVAFYSDWLSKRHMRIHFPISQCGFCTQALASVESLHEHETADHPQPQGEMDLIKSEGIVLAMRSPESEDTEPESSSGESSTSEEYAGGSKSKSHGLICRCRDPECDFIGHSDLEVQIHHESIHGAVYCFSCDTPFHDQEELTAHLQTGVHRGDGDMRYLCLFFCGVGKKSGSGVMQHLLQHELRFKCPYEGCPLRFGQVRTFRQHCLKHDKKGDENTSGLSPEEIEEEAEANKPAYHERLQNEREERRAQYQRRQKDGSDDSDDEDRPRKGKRGRRKNPTSAAEEVALTEEDMARQREEDEAMEKSVEEFQTSMKLKLKDGYKFEAENSVCSFNGCEVSLLSQEDMQFHTNEAHGYVLCCFESCLLPFATQSLLTRHLSTGIHAGDLFGEQQTRLCKAFCGTAVKSNNFTLHVGTHRLNQYCTFPGCNKRLATIPLLRQHGATHRRRGTFAEEFELMSRIAELEVTNPEEATKLQIELDAIHKEKEEIAKMEKKAAEDVEKKKRKKKDTEQEVDSDGFEKWPEEDEEKNKEKERDKEKKEKRREKREREEREKQHKEKEKRSRTSKPTMASMQPPFNPFGFNDMMGLSSFGSMGNMMSIPPLGFSYPFGPYSSFPSIGDVSMSPDTTPSLLNQMNMMGIPSITNTVNFAPPRLATVVSQQNQKPIQAITAIPATTPAMPPPTSNGDEDEDEDDVGMDVGPPPETDPYVELDNVTPSTPEEEKKLMMKQKMRCFRMANCPVKNCPESATTFTAHSDIQNHIIEQHNRWMCFTCQRLFTTASDLSDHLTSGIHKCSVKDTHNFVCSNWCGIGVKTAETLTTHVGQHELYFFCSWPGTSCTRRFASQEALKAHIEQTHLPMMTSSQQSHANGEVKANVELPTKMEE